MKLGTAIVGGTVLAVLALGVIQVGTGGWPVNESKSGGSQEMARARKVKIPEDRDKARVYIQVCYYPAEAPRQVTVPWKLGSELQYDIVGPPLNCQTPWARSALLKRGDTIMVGWILNTGTVSKFKARVTVNNRVAIDATDVINRAEYTCVLGAPPCGF
jgi:hypothetical protein